MWMQLTVFIIRRNWRWLGSLVTMSSPAMSASPFIGATSSNSCAHKANSRRSIAAHTFVTNIRSQQDEDQSPHNVIWASRMEDMPVASADNRQTKRGGWASWVRNDRREKQEAQLNARGVRPYCPQSYKYNHAVRIWEVDVVGRQKIVITSGIGLAAVLAVGHLSWWVKLCLSLYGKLWTVHC